MKVIIAIIVGLLALPVKANELMRILEGKFVVYKGTCLFDKKGKLTFKQEDKKTVVPCVVGMAPDDQTKHYVLVLNNGEPEKLYLYDEKDKSQKILWSKNAT